MTYEIIGVVLLAVVIVVSAWAAVMGAAEKALYDRREYEYRDPSDRAE